ncbi:MAG: hypothetical protein KBC36_04700 [Spirochaetia bacterium]|nr:hypothetical protein [Spirochaetia bacterium]
MRGILHEYATGRLVERTAKHAQRKEAERGDLHEFMKKHVRTRQLGLSI